MQAADKTRRCSAAPPPLRRRPTRRQHKHERRCRGALAEARRQVKGRRLDKARPQHRADEGTGAVQELVRPQAAQQQQALEGGQPGSERLRQRMLVCLRGGAAQGRGDGSVRGAGVVCVRGGCWLLEHSCRGARVLRDCGRLPSVCVLQSCACHAQACVLCAHLAAVKQRAVVLYVLRNVAVHALKRRQPRQRKHLRPRVEPQPAGAGVGARRPCRGGRRRGGAGKQEAPLSRVHLAALLQHLRQQTRGAMGDGGAACTSAAPSSSPAHACSRPAAHTLRPAQALCAAPVVKALPGARPGSWPRTLAASMKENMSLWRSNRQRHTMAYIE